MFQHLYGDVYYWTECHGKPETTYDWNSCAIRIDSATGKISSVISTYIQDKEIAELFISQTGSAYLVVAFMEASFFSTHDSQGLLSIKQEVTQALVKNYGYATLELALADNTT